MEIPRDYQKKCLLRRKSAILSVRWKFHCIAKTIVALFLYDLAILSLSTLFVAIIKPNTLSRGLSCIHEESKMHSNPLGPSE